MVKDYTSQWKQLYSHILHTTKGRLVIGTTFLVCLICWVGYDANLHEAWQEKEEGQTITHSAVREGQLSEPSRKEGVHLVYDTRYPLRGKPLRDVFGEVSLLQEKKVGVSVAKGVNTPGPIKAFQKEDSSPITAQPTVPRVVPPKEQTLAVQVLGVMVGEVSQVLLAVNGEAAWVFEGESVGPVTVIGIEDGGVTVQEKGVVKHYGL